MEWEKAVVCYTVLTAWCAVVVQLAVLPFFWKAEALFRDYSGSGALDSANSFIDSQKVIPALAEMFDSAREVQPDKRAKPEMSELLQLVDFVPQLRKAQAAFTEKEVLEKLYGGMQRIARLLWKTGLIHIVGALALPAPSWLDPGRLRTVAYCVAVAVASSALVATIACMVRYELLEKKFLNTLTANRMQV